MANKTDGMLHPEIERRIHRTLCRFVAPTICYAFESALSVVEGEELRFQLPAAERIYLVLYTCGSGRVNMKLLLSSRGRAWYLLGY
jgi:hypothetical protein